MRIAWRHLAVSVIALSAAGMLIAWLGVIDIRASTGHWRVTDWFLHWVMRSSVRTAAIGAEVPDLTNPALLPLAAGHYETACADCHGSPERTRSPVTLGMFPPPPALAGVVGSWSDAQLFEIVKHGVRYTGMPAWPAQSRDDEVWAMVAFLKRYTELDAESYRQLAGHEQQNAGADPQTLVARCNACHAPSRLGENSLIPILDGQSETYLRNSLQAYRTGKRPSGVMQAVVSGFDDEAISALAQHYANSKAPLKSKGTVLKLVSEGDPMRAIPACSSCHDKPRLNPAYPTLTGLGRDYIANQLRLFRDGRRGGGVYAHLMTRSAKNLQDEDIAALAGFYGRQPR